MSSQNGIFSLDIFTNFSKNVLYGYSQHFTEYILEYLRVFGVSEMRGKWNKLMKQCILWWSQGKARKIATRNFRKTISLIIPMIPSLNYAEIEVLIAIHQVKAEVQLGEIWRDNTILSSFQWNSDELTASSWFWSTLRYIWVNKPTFLWWSTRKFR